MGGRQGERDKRGKGQRGSEGQGNAQRAPQPAISKPLELLGSLVLLGPVLEAFFLFTKVSI